MSQIYSAYFSSSLKFSTKICLFLQVRLLQSSDKRDPNLKVNNQPKSVQGNSIKFHYTDNDFDHQIIRAYINAVTSNFNFLYVSFIFNIVKVSINILPIYLNIL